MNEEFLSALKLYNEKTEKLLNSRFLQYLKEKGMNVNLKIDEKGVRSKRDLDQNIEWADEGKRIAKCSRYGEGVEL